MRFGWLLLGFAVASCHGLEPRSGQPDGKPLEPTAITTTAASGTASAPSSYATAVSRTAEPTPEAAPVSPDQVAPAPRNCTNPRVEVRLPNDGGAIFDNAMTVAEAGHGDRARGVLDALRAQLPAFRCCFEPWALTTTSPEARALLRVTLAADGHAEAAEVVVPRSTVSTPATLACLVEAARSASYPPSPRQRSTIVEYPLRASVTR